MPTPKQCSTCGGFDGPGHYHPTALEESQIRASRKAIELADEVGYGFLINQLGEAWSARIQREYRLPAGHADVGAFLACAWCGIDRRTGKRAEGYTPQSREGASETEKD